MNNQLCKCRCGHTEFEVLGKSRLRMICHCTICQQFNDAAYADILVYKSAQVAVPDDAMVDFETYKRPPNVRRGKCVACGQATIEVFDFPLMPKLTMVPVAMFANQSQMPEPNAHMFYEKRVADASDDLPKKTGFMASQLAFFRYLWFKK